MSFSINFLNKQIKTSSDNFQIGQITINDYTETFQSSLSYWKKSKYRNQWKDAIQLLLSGSDQSCFVTSMFDPDIANYIYLWPLYVDKDCIHIRNKILFLEELEKPFNESCIQDYVSDRKITNEEGYRISEWNVHIDDLKYFLSNCKEE